MHIEKTTLLRSSKSANKLCFNTKDQVMILQEIANKKNHVHVRTKHEQNITKNKQFCLALRMKPAPSSRLPSAAPGQPMPQQTLGARPSLRGKGPTKPVAPLQNTVQNTVVTLFCSLFHMCPLFFSILHI